MGTTIAQERKRAIIDCQVAKKTKVKEYKEYLIKWRNNTVDEASWMHAFEAAKLGLIIPEFLKCS